MTAPEYISLHLVLHTESGAHVALMSTKTIILANVQYYMLIAVVKFTH